MPGVCCRNICWDDLEDPWMLKCFISISWVVIMSFPTNTWWNTPENYSPQDYHDNGKMYPLLKMVMFHCHVSFLGGIPIYAPNLDVGAGESCVIPRIFHWKFDRNDRQKRRTWGYPLGNSPISLTKPVSSLWSCFSQVGYVIVPWRICQMNAH